MKKLILSVFVAAIVSANSFAQDPARPMKTPEDRTERQVEKMNKDLSLTDEQKPKIKEIVLKREQAREELMKKYPEKNEAFREENKKLNAQSDEQIRAILTKEQLEKRKQFREDGMEKNKAGKTPQKEGSTPPPAPPAPQPK